ncbi:hypothetical protein LR48_Vigan09g226900 [Vigna angularis]|uniref:Senescence regulator n=2 Tax=Phaseolus angularis TaxID=3914 RepID=A0A0L9VFZ5_PHAAN|nr:uncharacterized protein LOC108342565 [Vigna angularis]KAG2395891.1 uncharacterized protein HKW66_Vig0067330 [Vigna angularis]KOM53609.1 hypothetical protein LR48_Vigan09g226800 [Vigna angularis]KOM53610.1 hypothetical protein LR48_Vigan09g226900 [Vigna angularis]BAT87269.1 hypothetical protein VIGAN_05062300 [Vigna angularis var. angularis]
MAEEFTESEVVFSDHSLRRGVKVALPPPQRITISKPVNIPDRMVRRWDFNGEEEELEEMRPPHEIVRQRVAGKMAFSVCTGNGRTLKGRDLSQVRNSILRLTGFLEA